MSVSLPKVEPPFVCIFCEGTGPFTSEEHIVPHSLGNDLVVLARGWVCDNCNNIFSAFESRVQLTSILGVERCRMGVVTKRKRPAHSIVHGVSWFAEPTRPPNYVTAEAAWETIPVLLSEDGSMGKWVFPLHDDGNADIARLLLKIGIEVISPMLRCRGDTVTYDITSAKTHLLHHTDTPWPYFVLLDREAVSRLTSIFAELPDEHEYIQSCGFDIFLYEVDGNPVLFFGYGAFFAAICLSSRDTVWRRVLVEWGVKHVGCPKQYAHLSA